jgi:N-acetylglucosaminyl-diphospho-decaprenol L-rhamnosyltransferase
VRVGLATLAAGRPEHLRRQAAAVARLGPLSRYVVVSMDAEPTAVPGATVVHLPAAGPALPLAAARNRAVAELAGSELVILLDVDCIPSAEMLARYVAAARGLGGGPGLLCGPVGYLDPLRDPASGPTAAERRRARGRVIRDFPASGVRRERRHELFWSLSYAVSPATHAALGGFDEGFVGYGAEDTDYGLRAGRMGIGLWFVGGAWAYHQHHRDSAPADLESLVANVRRFHGRWGRWPMPDRLAELARGGRIAWDPQGSECSVRAG